MLNNRIIRCILLLAILLTICLSVYAQDKKPDAAPAKDYSVTLKNLLAQEQKGIANADMYNQIGLCYYHLGNAGQATVWFLRALRMNSNHGEAKNNLAFAIERSLDREMYTPPSFLASVFQKVFDFLTLNSLALIVLLLLALTVFSLHKYLHLGSGEDKAVPVMWIVIFGFLLIITSAMLGYKYSGFLDNRKAVIMESEVQGYSGPGAEFGSLFTIHEGLVIHINRIDKNWALINLPNGGAGWVPLSALEKVRK
jgi:tetratricopeptide (TPR) repeat protein